MTRSTLTILTATGFLLRVATMSAQTPRIDSLRNVLKAEQRDVDSKDTMRFEALLALGNEYRQVDQDSAFHYHEAARAWAVSQDDDLKKGKALSEMGWDRNSVGDHDMARSLYNEALVIARTGANSKELNRQVIAKRLWADVLTNRSILLRGISDYDGALDDGLAAMRLIEELHEDKKLARVLGTIGNIYLYKGDHPLALDYYFKALRIYESQGTRSQGVSTMLGNIGMIYGSQDDHAHALEYTIKALEVDRLINNKEGESRQLLTLGSIYAEMKDPKRALEHFTLAADLSRQIDAKATEAIALLNMGHQYRSLKEYRPALENLHMSLAVSEEIGNKDGMASAYSNLGSTYLEMERYVEAERNMKIALELATEIGSISEIGSAHQRFSMLYERTGKFKDALAHYKAYDDIRDSVFSGENEAKMLEQKLQYDFEKKEAATQSVHEQENAVAAIEIAQQRTMRNITLAGCTLLLLLGLVGYRLDRRRRKTAHERDVAELRTKALRSQMNPHFIGNAMQSIHRYMDRNDAPKAGDLLIRFSELMRSVLENSVHQQVPLEEDMDVLRSYLEFERARSNEKFDFQVHVDPALSAANAQIPPLMVQPFLENAIQHGLMNKEGRGKLELKAELKDGAMRITVEDDGVGRAMPADQPTPSRRSLSTGITQERLDQLSKQTGKPAGFRIIDLPQGTRVEIDLPLNAAA